MAERLDGEDRVERIVRSIDVQEVAVHVLSQMSQALSSVCFRVRSIPVR